MHTPTFFAAMAIIGALSGYLIDRYVRYYLQSTQSTMVSYAVDELRTLGYHITEPESSSPPQPAYTLSLWILPFLCSSLFLLTTYSLPSELALLMACIFISTLLALSVIDGFTQQLPDHLTLSLLWLGLIVNSIGLFTDIHSALYGAIAGYLSLWSIFHLYKYIRKKDGMGYGDFKLFAALGAWLGWQALSMILFIAALSGIIGSLLHMRKKQCQPIAFGPYLSIAGLIVFFWHDDLNRMLLSLR